MNQSKMDDDDADQQKLQEDEAIEEYTQEELKSFLYKANFLKHVHDINNKYKEKDKERDPLYRMNKMVQDVEGLLKQGQLPQASFKSTLDKIYNNKMNMISQTIIPKIVTEEIKKKYKRAFRGILRDICIFTHDTSKLDDLMVLTILALTLIEKTVYLFEDEDDLNSILMMLLFVSIRQDSVVLLINSLYLHQFLEKMLQLYYFSQIKFNPICHNMILLVAIQSTYYKYVNRVALNMELTKFMIQIYKYYMDQKTKTENARNCIEEQLRHSHKKKKKKRQAFEEQEPEPEDLYLQVPEKTATLIQITMACFPSEFIQMKFEFKNSLFVHSYKQNDNPFNQIMSIRIIQNVASDPDPELRFVELVKNYQFLNYIFEVPSRNQTFQIDLLTIPVEWMRVLTNLLWGFDGTIFWMKMDNCQLNNDNSNYLRHFFDETVKIKINGHPYKLPIDSGLYYDGCGVDFRLGDGLEIVGQTPKFGTKYNYEDGYNLPSQVTVCFWMVYFTQKTQKLRKIETKHKCRTLLQANDGVISLVFTDPQMILFGITNIGCPDKKQDIEMLPVGVRFFKTNLEKSKNVFQGWNHVSIILDNDNCLSSLYINGFHEETIEGVYHKMNVKYIGNNKDLEEPFGYCCDIRIYPQHLEEHVIKKLGIYRKEIQLIEDIDLLDIFEKMKLMSELRKAISESQTHNNSEQCALALKAVSFLCYYSTKMRLEAAKQNLFDIALSFIQSSNKDLQYYALETIYAIQ